MDPGHSESSGHLPRDGSEFRISAINRGNDGGGRDGGHRRAAGEPLRDILRPRGPVQFSVEVRDTGDGTYLAVSGEVDVLTAPKLGAALHDALHREQGSVAVDLRDVTFVDSAGLHVLLNAQRRLTRTHRRLSVVCGEGPVRRVIELARLGETLGLVSDPAEITA
jgi:anti-sigma B factor antagonist